MTKFFTSIVVLFAVPAAVQAQSLNEAKQLIYHERYNSAEALLHTILKGEPGSTEAWYTLARAYMLNNKFKEIKDTLQFAPQEVKESPLLTSVQGHLLLKDNDSVEAKRNFEMALKDSKRKDPTVLEEIADAYINTTIGNAHEAIELLQKAMKKDKNNPALYVLLGDAYRKLIDGGNAYNAYQQALTKDANYAVAEYKIGKIYTSQNNPQAYLPYFEKAVGNDPLYAPALYELYYYYYYKDINQARDYLAKY
ncbi:MAG: tetratricopeptide repeat protein, partial [Bacteroidota bacterium]